MKIVVTGGLGVVGSWIVGRYLQDPENEVVVIDAAEAPRNLWIEANMRNGWPNEIASGRLRLVHNRIERFDVSTLGALISGAGLIVHAAASTGIPHSAVHPHDDWQSNVDATKMLLDAAVHEFDRDDCPPIVALSSVKPYKIDLRLRETPTRFEAMGEIGIDESAALEPDEPYAASKAAQSMLCMAYARSYDLPIVTLRCSNLYGKAPCHGPRHGWLTWFCISAGIGRPIEIQGTGKQTRDMLFSNDVFKAVEGARMSIDSTRGRVFNIGGGDMNTISVLEAANLLHEMTGVELRTGAPGRKNEDMYFCTDFGLFYRATKWQPTMHLRQGIDSIVAWAHDNRDTLRHLYDQV